MSDNELLLAMSEMLDNKLKTELQPIKEELQLVKQDVGELKQDVGELKQDVGELKQDVGELKQDVEELKQGVKQLERRVTNIELTLENEIKPDIQLLAENYVPAAKKYVEAVSQIETMQEDVDMLKKVVANHSEKLQKLA